MSPDRRRSGLRRGRGCRVHAEAPDAGPALDPAQHGVDARPMTSAAHHADGDRDHRPVVQPRTGADADGGGVERPGHRGDRGEPEEAGPRGKPTAPAVMLTATRPIGMYRAPMMNEAPRCASACSAQSSVRCARLAPHQPGRAHRDPPADRVGDLVPGEGAGRGDGEDEPQVRRPGRHRHRGERDDHGLAGDRGEEPVDRGEQVHRQVDQGRGREREDPLPPARVISSCGRGPWPPAARAGCPVRAV